MMLSIRRKLLSALLILLLPAAVWAGTMKITGRVLDNAGQAVSGAEVYAFDSANVKRPADFISSRTGRDGLYQLSVPPGQYWTMAVRRQGGATFGPLGGNDLFSGEPLVIEGGGDRQVMIDFTVMSLKEAALRSRKRNEELIRVTGKLVDQSGAPVAGAYAMADPMPSGSVPLYLSTWTEADGVYILYLPKGKIYLGAARAFPPPSAYTLGTAVNFEADVVGEDLVVPPEPSPGAAPENEER